MDNVIETGRGDGRKREEMAGKGSRKVGKFYLLHTVSRGVVPPARVWDLCSEHTRFLISSPSFTFGMFVTALLVLTLSQSDAFRA